MKNPQTIGNYGALYISPKQAPDCQPNESAFIRAALSGFSPTFKAQSARPSFARFVTLLIFATFSSILVRSAEGAAWPQFRGPNSSGVAEGASPPIQFGPKQNVLWQLSLDSGHSSPCISGDSLFLTTFDEVTKQFAVVCISRSQGKQRWRQIVEVEKVESGHPSFNPASSSPATDGERVVAYFGSYGLLCFGMDGEKLWEIKMPLTKSYAGNATSPAIYGDSVILYRGNHVDHFLLAVDKRTGKELWKAPQGEPFTTEMACTACPILSDRTVIAHTARSVQGYDLATGDRRWVTKCATTATSTPVIAGDKVLVAAWNKMGEPVLRPPFPSFEELLNQHDQNANQTIDQEEFPKLWIFHRPLGAEAPQNGATVRFRSADQDADGEISQKEWQQQLEGLAELRSRYRTHGLISIDIESVGIVEEASIQTLETRGIPEVPSPIYHDGYIYMIKNGGLLTCINVTTGQREYQIRTGSRGTHYASPLIASDHLFTTSGDGKISVLTLGPNPEILSTNDIEDKVFATPAIVDGVIYVRTHHSLYAFTAQE